MKQIPLIALAALLSSCGQQPRETVVPVPQASPSVQQPVPPVDISLLGMHPGPVQKLENCVALLKSLYHEDNKLHCGTGFFVNYDNRIFLVTANHVAEAMNPEGTVFIKQPMGFTYSITFRDLIGGRPMNWSHMPDTDCAVLELYTDVHILNILASYSIDYNKLNNVLNPPSREEPLLTIGFPHDFGYKNGFEPISRKTHAISDTLSDKLDDSLPEELFFIIDTPSLSGASGSPIFSGVYSMDGKVLPFGNYCCLGLVQGTLHDENNIADFSVIVPAPLIEQTILLARKQEDHSSTSAALSP